MWNIAQKRPFLSLATLALVLFLPGLFTLPPVDRDEARFAQASKQMVESGNFIDIRFQDVPRYKKPVGIYWLQAGAAKLFEAPPYNQIWAYRLPSLAGALMAVLLTFWAGRPLFGTRAAFLGAVLLAASVMLGAEARLAKTDAMLLAAIVAAQGVLARAYVAKDKTPLPWPLVLLFWAAQGAGILIKGPIAPLVSVLTILGLWAVDRRADYLKALRPLVGLPLLALIAAPWAVAIGIASHGQFFHDAVGGDMASKLAGGQETHGAPPGTYLVLATLTFWPGTLFLLPALGHAIAQRKVPALRFALAWALPVWLFFEIIPTKLPHYILPAYPALALLCGAVIEAALEGHARLFESRLGKLALAGFAGAALAFAAIIIFVREEADHVFAAGDLVIAAALLAAAGSGAHFFWHRRYAAAAAASVLAAGMLTTGTFGVLAPSLKAPWVSSRLAAALPRTAEGSLPPLIVSGFSEPSLVFLAGTATQFLPAETAAGALAVSSNPNALAAIATSADPDFRAALAAFHLEPLALGQVAGFNYSIGKPVTLTLYRIRP